MRLGEQRTGSLPGITPGMTTVRARLFAAVRGAVPGHEPFGSNPFTFALPATIDMQLRVPASGGVPVGSRP
jgi:hypothetical protein